MLKDRIKQGLIWSQKFTKIDMIYLGRGGFWITAGQIINTGFSFFVALAFANLLPKEIYGQYKYILSIVAVLGIFTLSGMRDAVSRAVARGQEGVLKTAIKFQLRWHSIFVIATNVIGIYYFARGNTTIAIPLFICAFAVPIARTFGTYGSFIEGKKDFGTLTIYDTISSLTRSLVLILVLLSSDNLLLLISTYIITDAIVNIACYYLTLKKYKPNELGKDDPDAIKYGTQLTFLSALGIITQQLDKILIFKYSGSIELAMYSIASALPERLKGFGKNIIGLSYPKLAQKNILEIQKVLVLRMIQALIFGGGLSLAYILTAPILFKIFFPQYLDSVFFSQLLSLMLPIMMPHFIVGYAIHAQQMVRALYITNISTSVSKSILYVIGGLLWGPIGIVLARVSSYGIAFILSLILWHSEVVRARNKNQHTLAE